MPLTPDSRDAERKRIAQMVLDLTEERGAEITHATAIAESGVSRARFDQIFDDYDDLFDAVAQTWLTPHIAAMEDVLATDLPPRRKLYEFFRRRFVISRDRWRQNLEFFTNVCEAGAANFERVRSYVDLADHYKCEIIAEAQAEGYFAGLGIDETLSLINQMVAPYTMPDALVQMGDKLTEEKLARIVDTIFIGLSGEVGEQAAGVNAIRLAPPEA